MQMHVDSKGLISREVIGVEMRTSTIADTLRDTVMRVG